MMIPVVAWVVHVRSPTEYYLNRALLGTAIAPVETLPEVTIPDIFFAHVRGGWTSFYAFTIFGRNYIGPLVAGWFSLAYGWRNTQYLGAALAALSFVVVFFFMEETMYFRKTFEGLGEDNQLEGSEENLFNPEETTDDKKIPVAIATEVTYPEERSYIQKFPLFRVLPDRLTNMMMFKNMYLPLYMLLLFPSVAWSNFIYGINLA
jgi:MFS family permease